MKTSDIIKIVRLRLGGILTFFAVLALIGCVGKKGPPIRIVVPNELRGLIRIIEDKSGTAIPEEGEEFVYRIPANGVLTVKQAVGFGQWHQQHANFANGLPLPILSTDAPDDGSGRVALYSLGRSEKQLRFFIGTNPELVKFLKAPPGASGL